MGKAPLAKAVQLEPIQRTGEDKGASAVLLVDARGVPLSIAVSGANTHDVKLLAKTLRLTVCERPKPRKWKPQHLCADAGYFASANKPPIQSNTHITDHRNKVGSLQRKASH